MSKRTSKLSRKCVNKNTQVLNNVLDKSSDEFQDDVRPFSRNQKNSNKDSNKDSKENTSNGPVVNIYSVCNKLSVKHTDNINKEDKCLNPPDGNSSTALSKHNSQKIKDCLEVTVPDQQAVFRSTEKLFQEQDEKTDVPVQVEISTKSSVDLNPTAITGELKMRESASLKIQPCPLCRKEFKIGHETKRISHLKECGTLLGVPAEDLVKMRRLEVIIGRLFIIPLTIFTLL